MSKVYSVAQGGTLVSYTVKNLGADMEGTSLSFFCVSEDFAKYFARYLCTIPDCFDFIPYTAGTKVAGFLTQEGFVHEESSVLVKVEKVTNSLTDNVFTGYPELNLSDYKWGQLLRFLGVDNSRIASGLKRMFTLDETFCIFYYLWLARKFSDGGSVPLSEAIATKYLKELPKLLAEPDLYLCRKHFALWLESRTSDKVTAIAGKTLYEYISRELRKDYTKPPVLSRFKRELASVHAEALGLPEFRYDRFYSLDECRSILDFFK